MTMTLDECVGEVLNHLTGLDLHYVPELDRYRSITKHLNRALRLVSIEHEWSYFSAIEEVGRVSAGQEKLYIRGSRRPRIILDDSLRLVDNENNIFMWAFFLPRESLHKHRGRTGLWVSHTRNELSFSRPISERESGLRALIPVMREPREFSVPATRESVEELITPPSPLPEGAELIQLRNFHNPDIVEEWVSIPGLPPYEYDNPEQSLGKQNYTLEEVREQLLDFPHPDLIILKAAHLYAQSDPVSQPRAQTLEAQYKDVYYSLVERDTNHTDNTYVNDYHVPIQSSLRGNPYGGPHTHPHSDERNFYNYR